jgi:hypothetical protein
MRLALTVLFLAVLVDSAPPEAGVPYFTNVREVHVTQLDRANYFVVDAELWGHARRDLGDLRLYDGQSPVQYAFSEQNTAVSTEEGETRILNLGSVAGHTEFDLDTGSIAEYDRVPLRLDAHDFVATAFVSGGAAPGKATEVELVPSTLYDFSKEQLGSNSSLKLPTSSFRYLHVRLSPGLRPEQVKGASISNLREQRATWVHAGSCAAAQEKPRRTEIDCEIPPNVPLNRVLFEISPAQINFRRTVSVIDAKGEQIASGDISRVRVNRGGMLVTNEALAISVSGTMADGSGHVTLAIDNEDNPPLAIVAAEPLSMERRIYFDPQGKSVLTLYYGDEKLQAPVYDYARFFHPDASAVEAKLGPGGHNAQYAGRPDDRPWSEQHPGILWGAMLVAVLALGVLALRGLKTTSP